jgi:hypothetical protein
MRRSPLWCLPLLLLTACATRPTIRPSYVFPDTGPYDLDLAGTWRFRLDRDAKGEELGWSREDLSDAGWDKIHAPGVWEEQGYFGAPADDDLSASWEYNGVAWYRRHVIVPRRWAGYDLVLDLGRVDDAGKAFWNGRLIGESHSADQDNRWTVPADAVRAGSDNVLAVRVTDFGGPGGLDGGPLRLRPVLPWSDLKIDLVDMPGDYSFTVGSPEAFNLLVTNPLPQGFFGTFRVVATPFERAPIHDDVHGPIWINPAPDDTKALGVHLGTLPAGQYDVDITLSCGGRVLAKRHRAIAVLQPVEHLHPEASPFALNSAALFHLTPDEIAEEGEKRLRQAAATGSVWGRNDLWWGQIETAPGMWDWDKCDSVVNAYLEHGIDLLAILCYDSAWSHDHSPATPEMRADYCEYARQMVRRYGARVPYWEIWNEPNLAEFWHPAPDLQNYIDLLRDAHAAIKGASPEAQVVGVCTSGVPLDFILPILDAGGGAWMDILSVHPYQVQRPTNFSPQLPHGQVRRLRDELDRRGLWNLPIWITEEGWPTIAGNHLARQARYVTEFYTAMLASGLVQRIHWFNLTDWGQPDLVSGGHFGLVEIDGTPKPSYAAYNNLIARLHDFDRVVDLSDPSTGRYRVRFHRPAGKDHGEEHVTVLWSEQAPRLVEVPDGARAIDLVGSPLATQGEDGHRWLRVGPSPLYIVEEITP